MRLARPRGCVFSYHVYVTFLGKVRRSSRTPRTRRFWHFAVRNPQNPALIWHALETFVRTDIPGSEPQSGSS